LPNTESNTIYISGPLFTEGERYLLEEIEKICQKAGFNTYLPHRDTGMFDRKGGSSKNIFLKDIETISEAALMISVLNGKDIDSGTSWEIGYCFAMGTPVIGYMNDSRLFDPENQINPMIFHALEKLVTSLSSLEETLAEKKHPAK
jgi:nucleoside 2-deoxyribosyltransferase